MRLRIGREGFASLSGLVVIVSVLASTSLYLPPDLPPKDIDAEPFLIPGELIITEVRDSPNGYEQIELFNQGIRTINLNGWRLIVDGTSIVFPIRYIYRGSYFTVGDPTSSHYRADITLGDEGGYVQIIDTANWVHDTVYYGQLGPAPDPIATESVARVRIGLVYNESWVRNPTPSFGAPNNLPLPNTRPRVVLNEVVFNSLNPNDRYIELYYKGYTSINIAGYRLVGDVVYTLPSIILSFSDPYHVIYPSHALTLFSNMNITGDNLYLYDSGEVFLDMVGWSSPHLQDMSMVRVPDGNGTAEGYNDSSSIVSGWQFDQKPTLPLVLIGPRQSLAGELGTRVFFRLNVTNKMTVSSYANIETHLGSMGWPMSLFEADGITPLQDSAGDSDTIPDIGLLASGARIMIQVAVDIPPSPPLRDWETSIVNATMADNLTASSSVNIVTNIYPYIWPTAVASPSTIWVEDAPPKYKPKESEVTLRLDGRGTPIYGARNQNTVFLIDSSGSMGDNDPTDLRLSAAKHYVDLLSVPDMAAVVDFDNDAILVNKDHLSSDYPRIKSNIDTIDSSGSTNLYDPIRIATNELLAYGDPMCAWVEILLTDGDDTTGHSDALILSEAERAADNGIVIYTIGLIGTSGIDEALLMEIARVTDGIYLRALSANDLEEIYILINQLVKMSDVAGYDDDINDNNPMVTAYLPDYINYVSGSSNPAPDYIGDHSGKTNLQWNLSELKINETWIATFNVTSSIIGFDLYALSYPYTQVMYVRYDDQREYQAFPETLIDVLGIRGKICGCKWYDRDKDGVKDATEPYIDGMKIELYQDVTFLDSTFTDGNGKYCFEELADGLYNVSEVIPLNPDAYLVWVQTYPGGDGTWSITIDGGNEVNDVNFGNVVEFTGSLTWGYWKTHTGYDSPPRDSAYDQLPLFPIDVDLPTLDNDYEIEDDYEAWLQFNDAGIGDPPNCSGTCRSLFRAQLLALYMNLLKFEVMGSLVYLDPHGIYDGWTVQEIVNEAIDKLLNGGSSYNFKTFQEVLDRINNNHNYALGSHVLVLPDPPKVLYIFSSLLVTDGKLVVSYCLGSILPPDPGSSDRKQ